MSCRSVVRSEQTCIQLAQAVGHSGSVLGVDISPAMVATAKRRTKPLSTIRVVEGDAHTFSFPAKSFDALFSRFGVMAFRDPVAAFNNLRRALKPRGRLAFVCWRRLEENDLDSVPLQAGLPFLPQTLTSDLGQTAPFSFSEPVHTRRVLEDAGFRNIQIVPHDEAVSSGDMTSMLELSLSFGPLGKIIRENPQFRDSVSEPVREALEKHGRSDDCALTAAVWIVTAEAQKTPVF